MNDKSKKNNPPTKDGDAQETSALYALGLLKNDEEQEFEAEIASSAVEPHIVNEDMQTVATFSELSAHNAPSPRKELKAKVMAGIARLSAVNPLLSDQYVLRSDQGEWQEFHPGIRGKILHTDAVTGMHTVLARLDAGARFPKHRHGGIEQCLVIEGQLQTDGVDLHAGDFVITPDGTIHSDTHTDGGCLLLLSTSLKDESLAE